jgi:hypothetical protein
MGDGMSAVSLDELIAVHEARMRLKKEASRALPAHAYRDPAQTVEFEAERARRQAAKQKKHQPNKRRG